MPFRLTEEQKARARRIREQEKAAEQNPKSGDAGERQGRSVRRGTYERTDEEMETRRNFGFSLVMFAVAGFIFIGLILLVVYLNGG